MFDSKRYQNEVFVPAYNAFKATTLFPDAFKRYGLDLAAEDGTQISEALEQVKQFWSKQANSTKFQEFANRLMNEHKALAPRLMNPQERGRLREAIQQERARHEQDRWSELDAQIEFCARGGSSRRLRLPRWWRRQS